MKFLQKGIEFNKIAKAFGKLYLLLNELDSKFNSGLHNDYNEFAQDILIMAFIFRRDVIDRIEEYSYPMASPIVVPAISKGKITLFFAHQQVLNRIHEYANILNITDEVNEITEKGDAFYQIEKLIS